MNIKFSVKKKSTKSTLINSALSATIAITGLAACGYFDLSGSAYFITGIVALMLDVEVED